MEFVIFHCKKFAFLDPNYLPLSFKPNQWQILILRSGLVEHSFQWHVQNVTIPCCSQELLPFLSVMYFFLPPFSTNCSAILSQLILPSISWSTSQFYCSQIPFGNSIFFHSLYMPKPT